MSDKELIDLFLSEPKFRAQVESELGKSIKVKVDWPNNEIVIQGKHQGRSLKIDETLEQLRGKMIQ